MKPAVRREEIVQLLKYSKDPVTGRFLAERFGVSRQVIVGDIAAIKEKGEPVISTPEGYLYRVKSEVKTVYKCYHTNEQTEEELRLIVSLGGGVEDVMVRHRIYGKLSAQLSIHKQEDVSRFMEEIRLGKSVPLMNVTSGYHYHTVTAQDEATLAVIEASLREKKFLVDAKPIDVED